jgi:hypothetical protein
MPSSTLRWYCCVASMFCRSAMAREALNGSSDGLLISLLEAAFICDFVSLSVMELRSASTFRVTIEVVMRMAIRDPPDPCG